MNNDFYEFHSNNDNDNNKEQDQAKTYVNQVANSTQMIHSFHAAQSQPQTVYGEWEETEESTRSFYQVLCIALAAGFGVNFLTAKFFAPTINAVNPFVPLIIYAICAIVGSIVLHKGESLSASIVGYALLVIPLGVCITPMVTMFYSPTIVTSAFMGTTIITAGMITLSYLYPNAFLSMGRALFMSLLFSLIASIICAFVAPGVLGIIDYICIIIFGLYIGYDVAKTRVYPRTPQFAIRAAADLYLDIINIFIRLLEIMGSRRD